MYQSLKKKKKKKTGNWSIRRRARDEELSLISKEIFWKILAYLIFGTTILRRVINNNFKNACQA